MSRSYKQPIKKDGRKCERQLAHRRLRAAVKREIKAGVVEENLSVMDEMKIILQMIAIPFLLVACVLCWIGDEVLEKKWSRK